VTGPRTDFLDALRRQLVEAGAEDAPLTLVLLDLDDFAAVSARLGPLRATALLGELERRLGESARRGDLVCRTGGDGLAAVLPAGDRLEAERLVARLQASLGREPPADARVGVSAGIATARPGERPIELLARAAKALGEAKQAGKGTAKAAL
jgi:diguanylate cyclase (GGDEF)-like protein